MLPSSRAKRARSQQGRCYRHGTAAQSQRQRGRSAPCRIAPCRRQWICRPARSSARSSGARAIGSAPGRLKPTRGGIGQASSQQLAANPQNPATNPAPFITTPKLLTALARYPLRSFRQDAASGETPSDPAAPVPARAIGGAGNHLIWWDTHGVHDWPLCRGVRLSTLSRFWGRLPEAARAVTAIATDHSMAQSHGRGFRQARIKRQAPSRRHRVMASSRPDSRARSKCCATATSSGVCGSAPSTAARRAAVAS